MEHEVKRQIKLRLMLAISDEISKRFETQHLAGKFLGMVQARVNRLLKFQTTQFSIDTLVVAATALEIDIILSVRNPSEIINGQTLVRQHLRADPIQHGGGDLRPDQG